MNIALSKHYHVKKVLAFAKIAIMPDKSPLTMLQHLHQLLAGWSDWDDYADYYLGTLLPSLQANPGSGTQHERRLMHEIRDLATAGEWAMLPTIAADIPAYQSKVTEFMEKILGHLKQHDFAGAESLATNSEEPFAESAYYCVWHEARANTLANIHGLFDHGDFERAQAEHIANALFWNESERSEFSAEQALRKRKRTEQEIEAAFKFGSFENARKLIEGITDQASRANFGAELEQRQRVFNRKLIVQQIRQVLERFDFSEADRIFGQRGVPTKIEYEKLKAQYIQE